MSPAPHDGRLPGLHGPAVPEPDPAVVSAVDAAVAAWVEREDVCPPAFRPELAGLGVGRAVALQYPDHAGPDHLLAAAALLVAEFVAWESCADDPDGSPADLVVRLLLTQSALDPADGPDGLPGPADPPGLPDLADPADPAGPVLRATTTVRRLTPNQPPFVLFDCLDLCQAVLAVLKTSGR